MTNRLCNLGLATGILLIGTTALAQAPASSRGAIEIGLRLGVGFPLGHEGQVPGDTSDNKLSDDVKAIVPIQIDAGYRINPNVYVGLFFQYGFGIVNTDNAGCSGSGTSCSASDLRLGANLHYHFAPGQTFDPWLGVGAGYEWLTLSASNAGLSVDGTATGFEFGNLQLGGDVQMTPTFAAGPFVSITFGEYGNLSLSSGGNSMSQDITSKAFHEWLEFGIRGAFDINL